MYLIIAEKPSLARNILSGIAKVQDKELTKKNGYYEGGNYIVTWVFGHLFSLADIEDYSPTDNPKWSMDNIPCFPKEFKFNLKKMSVSGALYDENKLLDVSKIKIASMSSTVVYEKLTAWAKEFDAEFYNILTENPEYTKAVLAIDRDVPKPRKDIAKWKDAKDYVAYFFEELYKPNFEIPENINPQDAKAFLEMYKDIYNSEDDRQSWFNRIKELCPTLNFASESKEYKANPEQYKGQAGDLSTVLRIAVTGRRNTPDLCSIMQVLGKEKCISRINEMINSI